MKPFIKKEKKGRILSKINSIDEGLICLHPLLCMFLCSSPFMKETFFFNALPLKFLMLGFIVTSYRSREGATKM